MLQHAQNVIQVTTARSVQLVTASGDKLPILQHVKASIQLGELNVLHEFVVIKTLVAPVILGIDFLQGNGLMLDFTHNPVAVTVRSPKLTSTQSSMAVAQIAPIYKATQKGVFQACAVSESEDNIVDECVIPDYTVPSSSELPACPNPKFCSVIVRYCKLFCTTPGYTEDAWHYIPTVGNPVKVSPRCIPAHHCTEVCQQFKQC